MLEVWMLKGEHYARYKAFPICFHSGELGPKLREGDRQSPEGLLSGVCFEYESDIVVIICRLI